MMRWQQTQCPLCHRMLMYQAGAANLLCPACQHLLVAQQHRPGPGQTACQFCSHLIQHQLGLHLLQCPICANATPSAPLLTYICRGCSLYLMYSSSVPSVVCPMCFRIEPPVPSSVTPVSTLLPLIQNAPPRPKPILPPRRIPWLPSTPVRPLPTPRSPQTQRASSTTRPRIHTRNSEMSSSAIIQDVLSPPSPLSPTTTPEISVSMKSQPQQRDSTSTQQKRVISTDQRNGGANGDELKSQGSQKDKSEKSNNGKQ